MQQKFEFVPDIERQSTGPLETTSYQQSKSSNSIQKGRIGRDKRSCPAPLANLAAYEDPTAK
jgi:hypothetical protein